MLHLRHPPSSFRLGPIHPSIIRLAYKMGVRFASMSHAPAGKPALLVRQYIHAASRRAACAWLASLHGRTCYNSASEPPYCLAQRKPSFLSLRRAYCLWNCKSITCEIFLVFSSPCFVANPSNAQSIAADCRLAWQRKYCGLVSQFIPLQLPFSASIHLPRRLFCLRSMPAPPPGRQPFAPALRLRPTLVVHACASSMCWLRSKLYFNYTVNGRCVNGLCLNLLFA